MPQFNTANSRLREFESQAGKRIGATQNKEDKFLHFGEKCHETERKSTSTEKPRRDPTVVHQFIRCIQFSFPDGSVILTLAR